MLGNTGLEMAAHWASILTCAGGVYAYLSYRLERVGKTNRLKKYLKESAGKAEANGKKGQFSATHLIRHVGLTQEEILQASIRSKHIHRFVKVKEGAPFADSLLFAYSKNDQK